MSFIKPGTKLANGSTVIHYTHVTDGGDGVVSFGIALCIPAVGNSAYATWRVWVQDGKLEAGYGVYHDDFHRAYTRYADRAGVGDLVRELWDTRGE